MDGQAAVDVDAGHCAAVIILVAGHVCVHMSHRADHVTGWMKT